MTYSINHSNYSNYSNQTDKATNQIESAHNTPLLFEKKYYTKYFFCTQNWQNNTFLKSIFLSNQICSSRRKSMGKVQKVLKKYEKVSKKYQKSRVINKSACEKGG